MSCSKKDQKRTSVAHAFYSEEKEVSALRLVLQSHVATWTGRVVLDERLKGLYLK